MQNRFIVDIFLLAGLDHLVRVKLLVDQMWAYHISKNHTISVDSVVDSAMLHHSMSTNNERKTTYL